MTESTTDPAPPKSRRALLIAAVAVAALLVGSAAGVGTLILLGWRVQPEGTFAVSVFLDTDAAPEHRTAATATKPGMVIGC